MNELRFWLSVWGGIAAAGSFFGMLLGGFVGLLSGEILMLPLGSVVGAITAGLLGLVVTFTLGTLVWATWMSRIRIFTATVCGLLTGLLSTAYLWAGVSGAGWVGSCLAAVLGALGARVAAKRFLDASKGGQELQNVDQGRAGKIELHELFTHMAALAVVLALWTTLFRWSLSNAVLSELINTR